MTKLLERLRGHRPDAEALSAYLDGRLERRRAAALEEHLRACETCAMRLDELQAVRESLSTLPEAAAPRSFRLRAADLERARGAAAPAAWMRFAPTVGAAAVVVLAVLIGVDLAGDGDGDAGGFGGMAASRASDEQIASAGESAADYFAPDAAPTAVPPAGAPAPSGEQPERSPDVAPADGRDATITLPTIEAPPEGSDEALRRMAPTVGPDKADVIRQPTPPGEFDAAEADDAGADDADDDGPSGLRIAQIVAGGVAVAAAAAVGGQWLWRRREA